jgi:hypothetical protein
MADNNDSLSVLQQMAGQNQAAPAPDAQAAPQDSLAVLQQVSGTTPINMTGPNGEKVQIPQNQVNDARAKNYAVSPDNPGVQRMATPDGKITYALPDEVEKFVASGHTPIQPDNNYRVMPLPGEDFQDVAKRAMNVAKALGTEGQQKAEQSEFETDKKNLKSPDPRRNPLVAAPILGVGIPAAEVGLAELGGAGMSVLRAAGPPVAQFARQVGGEIVKKYAGQTTAKVTADLLVKGAGAVGLGYLAKLGFGGLVGH